MMCITCVDILFRLGELISYCEGAEIFAKRAAAAANDSAHEKSLKRFDANTFALMSRVYAREAAARVALDGSRWVAGAADPGSPALAAVNGIPTAAIQTAQAGLVTDMDAVADAIYGRN